MGEGAGVSVGGGAGVRVVVGVGVSVGGCLGVGRQALSRTRRMRKRGSERGINSLAEIRNEAHLYCILWPLQ